MAQRPLTLNIENFVDPATGKPVALGNVYIGAIDLDPKIEANRVSVLLVEETGVQVSIAPAAQPLQLSAGGVIQYNGSPVVVLVDGSYSLAITNQLGSQIYYVPRANAFLDEPSDNGLLVQNGSFENETVTLGLPDQWNVSPSATGTIEIDDVVMFHGRNSLKFTSVDVTGAGLVFTGDLFPVSEDQPLFVAFDYLSTAVNTRTKARLNWYDETTTLISGVDILDNTAANPVATFERFQTLVTPPPTARLAHLVLRGMDQGGTTMAGSTWFDDVVVLAAYDLRVVAAAVTRPAVDLSGGTLPLVDFLDIPAYVTNIKMHLDEVSTNGIDAIVAYIGDASGIDQTATYNSRAVPSNSTGGAIYSNGFNLTPLLIGATDLYRGVVELNLIDPALNKWSSSCMLFDSGGSVFQLSNGTKTLSQPLDRVRLEPTVGSANVFDAGAVSITYR